MSYGNLFFLHLSAYSFVVSMKWAGTPPPDFSGRYGSSYHASSRHNRIGTDFNPWQYCCSHTNKAVILYYDRCKLENVFIFLCISK